MMERERQQNGSLVRGLGSPASPTTNVTYLPVFSARGTLLCGRGVYLSLCYVLWYVLCFLLLHLYRSVDRREEDSTIASCVQTVASLCSEHIHTVM